MRRRSARNCTWRKDEKRGMKEEVGRKIRRFSWAEGVDVEASGAVFCQG